jgi:hypothetical protein
MHLSPAQSYALLEKHGSYIKEVCDKCGAGIGPVSFTRKDQIGVWCSRECRDGIPPNSALTNRPARVCLECGVTLIGKRADSEFCSSAHKMRFHRKAKLASRIASGTGSVKS